MYLDDSTTYNKPCMPHMIYVHFRIQNFYHVSTSFLRKRLNAFHILNYIFKLKLKDDLGKHYYNLKNIVQNCFQTYLKLYSCKCIPFQRFKFKFILSSRLITWFTKHFVYKIILSHKKTSLIYYIGISRVERKTIFCIVHLHICSLKYNIFIIKGKSFEFMFCF